LFLAAAQGTARAQQGASRLSAVLCADPSRDAPEPYVPSIAEPPPGSEVRPWKTWTTGQDVDCQDLVSIGLGIAMHFCAGGRAESSVNRVEYSDIYGDAIAEALEFVLHPVPAVGIGFRGWVSLLPSSQGTLVISGISREVEFGTTEFGAFLLILEFVTPLGCRPTYWFDSAWGAPDWQGIAPCVRFYSGYGGLAGQDVSCPPAWPGTSGEEQLFIQSREPVYGFSAGLQARLWHLSLFVEAGWLDFGLPGVRSVDPGWGIMTRVDRFQRAFVQAMLSFSF
jgi:hypothetical protein